MNDNFHLYMSLFVIALVSFFVLIISIPLEPEIQETVRKSSLHQCQKTVMDQYELYKRDLQMKNSLLREDVASWDKFVLERMNHFSNMLKQNCQDNTNEWLTDEYQSKMNAISRMD